MPTIIHLSHPSGFSTQQAVSQAHSAKSIKKAWKAKYGQKYKECKIKSVRTGQNSGHPVPVIYIPSGIRYDSIQQASDSTEYKTCFIKYQLSEAKFKRSVQVFKKG